MTKARRNLSESVGQPPAHREGRRCGHGFRVDELYHNPPEKACVAPRARALGHATISYIRPDNCGFNRADRLPGAKNLSC